LDKEIPRTEAEQRRERQKRNRQEKNIEIDPLRQDPVLVRLLYSSLFALTLRRANSRSMHELQLPERMIVGEKDDTATQVNHGPHSSNHHLQLMTTSHGGICLQGTL